MALSWDLFHMSFVTGLGGRFQEDPRAEVPLLSPRVRCAPPGDRTDGDLGDPGGQQRRGEQGWPRPPTPVPTVRPEGRLRGHPSPRPLCRPVWPTEIYDLSLEPDMTVLLRLFHSGPLGSFHTGLCVPCTLSGALFVDPRYVPKYTSFNRGKEHKIDHLSAFERTAQRRQTHSGRRATPSPGHSTFPD